MFVDRERTIADLTIRWNGGASTKLTSRLNHTGGHRYVTSEQVNELVRQVAPYYTDEQIAFMLITNICALAAATASRPLELATCDAGWACRPPIQRTYRIAVIRRG